MKKITRKGEVAAALDQCFQAYGQQKERLVSELENRLLHAKVKFPLLEYCAFRLFETLPEDEHLPLCDQIAALETIGGNVLLGIILQNRLRDDFKHSVEKAAEYIAAGREWYVCDIIGERVWGHGLLTDPGKMFPVYQRLSTHSSRWVVRSIGAGGHYAIKKGLGAKNVDHLFQLLLTMGATKDHQIKQGIGWAAKTTAKFHPDIIEKYRESIDDKLKIGNWFRTKVRIGLERNAYAKGNRS